MREYIYETLIHEMYQLIRITDAQMMMMMMWHVTGRNIRREEVPEPRTFTSHTVSNIVRGDKKAAIYLEVPP
jgi:hypothetical protein